MKRYDALNAAAPGDPYVNANVLAGTEGSYPDARGFDAVMTEIEAAIAALGGEPTNASWTQLGTQILAAIDAAVAGSAAGKVNKVGDTMTGALSIALAALQLNLRHSDNTATLKDHLRLFRGTGAGARAAIQTLGDAANGLSEIDLNFLNAVDGLVKAFKFKNSGRLELGADPALALEAATKQYVDGLIFPAANNAETLALAITNKWVTPGSLGALVASATQRGIQRNATVAEGIALSANNVTLTPNNIANGRWRSAAITPVFGSSGSVTHGLGVAPRTYRLIFRCIAANNDYQFGEEFAVAYDAENSSQYGANISLQSATTLKWRLSVYGVRLINDLGSWGTVMAGADWQMYVEAEIL